MTKNPANPQPKVSVLFPVYNTGEEHLREAVDSILVQTYSDFEFIILNDASTDPNVERVALSYQDPRIRYFVNPENLGISGTRNRLIDLAQGEYLAVMDHDDVSLPERFAKEVEYLDAHPEVGVVSCAAEVFQEVKTVLRHPVDDGGIRLALTRICAVVHSASMIRKRVLEETGIRYEEEFSPAEDYALWCRLIPHTCFHNLPDVLFRYRMFSGNTTARRKDAMARATSAIWRFVKIDYPGLYAAAMDEAVRITKYKPFGFIPFLTIVRRGRRRTCFLFGIPLYRSKMELRFSDE